MLTALLGREASQEFRCERGNETRIEPRSRKLDVRDGKQQQVHFNGCCLLSVLLLQPTHFPC